ncbi:MAG: Na+/H+ antiporter NhaC family protein [Actinomycetaceae bacterium]|nr:Na+/H+ antiporter NhaC family protein [Actinomycetaceae bacterium]
MPHEKSGPSFTPALVTFLTVIATISIGLAVFHVELHLLMLIALIIVITSALTVAKRSPKDIAFAIGAGLWEARTALVIFILIGALIAALIQAGTVATLIHWGITLIHPGWFLPAALILSCLMSIATGTAWGTAGTAGVVLIGIGAAMDIPLPLVAGTVVSGAAFGDKMSPVSDTTNLAAMAADTDLYHHIRSMTYTTGPTLLIVSLAYTITGRTIGANPMPQQQLDNLSNAIFSQYHVGWVTTLPFLVLIGFGLARIKAIWSMLASTLTAIAVGWLYQDTALGQILRALWAGGSGTTGVETVDNLFSRGGVLSMWFTLLLSVQALALGAMLSRFGYMHTIIAGLLRRVRRVGSLVATTISAALVGNLGMGEAYMSIVLGGQLFRDEYDRRGIDRAVLSRCLEEGATLTTPLIPWTTAGVFFAGTLTVPTQDYLPYAWLNLLNPLVGIVFAYLGWGLLNSKAAQPKGH